MPRVGGQLILLLLLALLNSNDDPSTADVLVWVRNKVWHDEDAYTTAGAVGFGNPWRSNDDQRSG